MASIEKVIWVVNYRSLNEFMDNAVFVKATAVAIRTDNDLLRAIPAFHDKGIKVYGWRWPLSNRVGAMREANAAADLMTHGLDGYYVDPEGRDGYPYDWDLPGLEDLAEDFCRTITSASTGKPFGVTSHYRGKYLHEDLPWASFFKYATIFLPQAYWRSGGGRIGTGIPEENYRLSIDHWIDTGAPKDKIVPMAGEIHLAAAAEINAYANEAEAQDVSSLHFYTYQENVPDLVWDAIRRA